MLFGLGKRREKRKKSPKLMKRSKEVGSWAVKRKKEEEEID